MIDYHLLTVVEYSTSWEIAISIRFDFDLIHSSRA